MSRRLRWAGHVASKGRYRALVRKPEAGKPLGRPGVDGRIILKWIFKNLDGGIDWIDLTQDRDRWWAFVNAVMNRRIP
jgi:transposase